MDYALRLLIFENEQMIGVEREVVVPEKTTALDLHLLVYAIYRAAFIAAEIKDGEQFDPAPLASREQLLKEFRTFWPDNDRKRGKRSRKSCIKERCWLRGGGEVNGIASRADSTHCPTRPLIPPSRLGLVKLFYCKRSAA